MINIQTIIYVLALMLCLIIQFSSASSSHNPSLHPFPKCVIDEMSSRRTRYHHFLWHNVRDFWVQFTPEDQAELKALGWEVKRPSLRYDGDGNAIANTENDSGE